MSGRNDDDDGVRDACCRRRLNERETWRGPGSIEMTCRGDSMGRSCLKDSRVERERRKEMKR